MANLTGIIRTGLVAGCLLGVSVLGTGCAEVGARLGREAVIRGLAQQAASAAVVTATSEAIKKEMGHEDYNPNNPGGVNVIYPQAEVEQEDIVYTCSLVEEPILLPKNILGRTNVERLGWYDVNNGGRGNSVKWQEQVSGWERGIIANFDSGSCAKFRFLDGKFRRDIGDVQITRQNMHRFFSNRHKEYLDRLILSPTNYNLGEPENIFESGEIIGVYGKFFGNLGDELRLNVYFPDGRQILDRKEIIPSDEAEMLFNFSVNNQGLQEQEAIVGVFLNREPLEKRYITVKPKR